MMAFAVRGKIAVTGDMVPTIVFGLSVIDRWEGLPICTKAELVLLHHLVKVLPESASLSCNKCSFFRRTTLYATSEVGPAVSLFVAEVCEVLRFYAISVRRYQ